MTEIICAAITAASAIVCALVASQNKRREKAEAERIEREERRAAMRMRESHLQLRLLEAETSLTIGVALGLKRGKCNGELEEGLKKVQAAREEYETFLQEIATEHLSK